MVDEYKQDEELKKALKGIYENIEIPDSKPAWLKAQAQLNKRKRRKQWKRRMKISIAIVLCSFFGSVLFNSTTETAYSQISSLYKRIQNQVIEIFYEEPEQTQLGAKTSYPENNLETDMGISQMKEVTLDEAKTIVSFHLILPTKAPESFQLDTIRVFSSSEGIYNHVQLEYADARGDIINIIQHEIEGKTSGLKAEIAINAGEYKDVVINGNKAILMLPTEGNTNLEWLTENRIMVRISGRFSESDIINLAESLQ